MLTYRSIPNGNIVEIRVDGPITAESLEQLAAKIKTDIKKNGNIRILEELQSFEGIDPG